MMTEEELAEVRGYVQGHRIKAQQGLDGDKDTAAQAVKLEKDTGADSQVIYGSPEAFIKDYTSSLTSRMLDRNPGLADYINSHPMASIVSKDDWNRMADFYDKMDYYTGTLSKVPHIRALKGLLGAGYGFMQGYTESFWGAPVGGWMEAHKETKEFMERQHPYVQQAIKAAQGPAETLLQLLSSIPAGVASGAEGAATAMGASSSEARRVGREFGGMAEYATQELVGTGLHPPHGLPVQELFRRSRQIQLLADTLDTTVPEASKALKAAEPYINAGEMPPPGVHPVWDGVIAEDVKQKMSVYDALVDSVERTETKELSPDMLKIAADQNLKGQYIHLHWDAVKALYGEKIPEPGDGKLGDVKSVLDQFEAAVNDRTDIRIEMPEWLAYVDKETKKLLHDDIRLRQSDPTIREAEAFPKLSEAINDLKQPEPERPPPTREALQDAGLTDSEMQNVSKQKAQEIDEGHAWINGAWRKVTADDVAKAKEARARGDEAKAKDLEKFEAAIEAVKDDPNKYPNFNMLGADWQVNLRGHPDTKEGFIAGGRQALENKYRHDAWNASRLERILARSKPASETPEVNPEALADPGLRMSRLRIEYANELKLRSPTDPVIKALRAVSGYEWKPEELSKAITWAHLNNRPDIVQRALEMSRLTDPEVHARLEAELYELKRREAAQEAANNEVGRTTFSIDDWTNVDTTVGEAPDLRTIDQLVESGEWVRMGGTTVMKVTPETLAARDVMRNTLEPLLQRFIGKGTPSLAIGEAIRYGRQNISGASAMYLTHLEHDPLILVAISSLDRASSLRHEVLHHLRQYGYISRQEWTALTDAAKREGWVKKHGLIEKGYDPKKPGTLLEEAIAHEWQSWADKKSMPADTAVGRFFQKLWDFFENARIALKQLFGGRLNEQEIFQAIWSGKVGQRGPGEPLYSTQAKDIRGVELAQREEVHVPKIEEAGPAFLGLLAKDRYAKWQKLIDAENARNVRKLYADAEKDAKKRLTPEWQKNYAEQYKQSIEDIKNRPDFRAATFMRTGKIGEGKLESLPKLDPSFLTEEQKQALPQNWLRAKDGFNPDQLANFFGYATGKELVDALVKLENAKGRMKPQTFLELHAAQEAERRMVAKYGALDENIMKEAREHAISLERFDLMHEEYLLMGQKLGQEMPLTKKMIKDQAWEQFRGQISSQVPLIRYIRELGKSNKQTEKLWLAGDALGAFVERQHALRLQALAELAKQHERVIKSEGVLRRRYSKREVDGRPPEFTNWVHYIYNMLGTEIRDPNDLAIQIDKHEYKTLKEFVESRSLDGLPESLEEFDGDYNPNMPVWEKLMDPDWKPKHIDALTVGEFTAVRDSIFALDKIGREELTTILEGQAVERDLVLDKMVTQFEAAGKEGLPAVGDPGTIAALKKTGMRLNLSLIQMEYIWGRLDKTPYGGIFWKAFTKPFAEAGNEFRLLIRDYSTKLTALGKETTRGVDLGEKISHDIFAEPLYGQPDPAVQLLQNRMLGNGYLTRANLRAVMVNVGNASNLDKLARGYHTTPEAIMDWVNTHATKEDWAYARGVWKLWDEIRDKADLMSMNLHGVTPVRIPKLGIMTPFGNFEGGYYPMIYDRSRGGGGKGGKIDPNLPSNVRVLTDRGFEKARTGYAGPVYLGLEHIGFEMTRQLRDLAFREVLIESQKYFRNSKFTNAMTKHLGADYTALLIPYLRDIAGIRGPTSSSLISWEGTQNFVIQNTIGTLVGWNPGTIVKHTGTAWVQSFKELKHKSSLIKAAYDVFIGPQAKANRDFMMKGGQVGKLMHEGSGELQGRRPHWYQTFGGASDVVSGKSTVRAKLAEVYSWGIAASDQAASMMLWHAKYTEMMEEFKATKRVEDAHTEAVAIADQAVRRTHGSTAITSRPAVMRDSRFAAATALYGFFNHNYNRMYEMTWQGRDIAKDLKKGEANFSDVAKLASSFFFVVAFPALVEEVVTPLYDKEDRSLMQRWGMGLWYPVASAFPVLREIVHAAVHDRDPAYGIISASYKGVTDLTRAIKAGKFDVDTFGDTLMATTNLVGIATGLVPAQVGRWEKLAWNYFVSQNEQPQNTEEWMRALRWGTSRERRH